MLPTIKLPFIEALPFIEVSPKTTKFCDISTFEEVNLPVKVGEANGAKG